MKHPDRKERSRKRMGSGWVWPPWSARAAPPSLAHAREVQPTNVEVPVQGAGLPLPARARCNAPGNFPKSESSAFPCPRARGATSHVTRAAAYTLPDRATSRQDRRWSSIGR